MAEPKARTRWRLVLLIVLIGLLLADFCFINTRKIPVGRMSDVESLHFPVTQINGQWELKSATDTYSRLFDVGVLVYQSSTARTWAPTHIDLRVYVMRSDVDEGRPSVSDSVRLGNAVADRRGKADVIATLLRQGGGTHTEPLPWGYVHNAVAALLALGIVACIAGMIKDRVIAARTTRRIYRGLCIACGYPSPPSGVCPECGIGVKKDAEGPSGEASA